jgi:hypothetical protein
MVNIQIYDQGVLLEEQLIPECEARAVAEHYERRGYEVRVEAA